MGSLQDDKTCQQIASLLPLWPWTMGHHMPERGGNEWISFMLAPLESPLQQSPPPPNPAGASVAPSPTQTDEPTLRLTAALLSSTGNHTTAPTGRGVGLNLQNKLNFISTPMNSKVYYMCVCSLCISSRKILILLPK